MTTRTQQLTGNEAALLNSARAQLKSFADKLRVLCDDADQALIQMDAQLEDFDAEHPERTELTTTQRKQAQEQR
jgi:tRNA U34 5-methylaminomethyl-2-thiouridine-forming methyltransferase MnmC